jgi:hypothetical protein
VQRSHHICTCISIAAHHAKLSVTAGSRLLVDRTSRAFLLNGHVYIANNVHYAFLVSPKFVKALANAPGTIHTTWSIS